MHEYKEYRFYSEDCTQEWKCRSCGKITKLPASAKPTDYHDEKCQGGNDNVYRTDPDDMRNLPGRSRLRTGGEYKETKNGLPVLRV